MRAIVYLVGRLEHLLALCRKGIRRFESAMRIRYRPEWLALLAAAVILVTASITLFFPPYLGLSNDGSFDAVLADTGLARMSDEDTSAYFNYYERTYRISPSIYAPNTTSGVLKAVVGLAVAADNVLTQDDVFDVRVLAGIYLALYLAVLYPLMKELLSRVRFHVEGMVIAVFCVLIFGDTSIITRFASFYTQPLELILLIAIMDCVFIFPRERDGWLGALGLAASAILLMGVNPYCALAGVIFSMAYWLHFMKVDTFHRVTYILLALVLCVVSVGVRRRCRAAKARVKSITK